MGDWLGTGRRRGMGWRTFKKARTFGRSQGLNGFSVEEVLSVSQEALLDPAEPNSVCGKEGGRTWDDWLGTGRGVWLQPFEKARAFVVVSD